MLHDERLSDVWALGVCSGSSHPRKQLLTLPQVTMYEIVIGRTPFEKTETEEFLSRETLEIYCASFRVDFVRKRAHDRSQIIARRWELSAAISRSPQVSLFVTFRPPHADRDHSAELDSLIHGMVEPNVNLRLQSCGQALAHRFFDPPMSSVTHKSCEIPRFSLRTAFLNLFRSLCTLASFQDACDACAHRFASWDSLVERQEGFRLPQAHQQGAQDGREEDGDQDLPRPSQHVESQPFPCVCAAYLLEVGSLTSSQARQSAQLPRLPSPLASSPSDSIAGMLLRQRRRRRRSLLPPRSPFAKSTSLALSNSPVPALRPPRRSSHLLSPNPARPNLPTRRSLRLQSRSRSPLSPSRLRPLLARRHGRRHRGRLRLRLPLSSTRTRRRSWFRPSSAVRLRQVSLLFPTLDFTSLTHRRTSLHFSLSAVHAHQVFVRAVFAGARSPFLLTQHGRRRIDFLWEDVADSQGVQVAGNS